MSTKKYSLAHGILVLPLSQSQMSKIICRNIVLTFKKQIAYFSTRSKLIWGKALYFREKFRSIFA